MLYISWCDHCHRDPKGLLAGGKDGTSSTDFSDHLPDKLTHTIAQGKEVEVGLVSVADSHGDIDDDGSEDGGEENDGNNSLKQYSTRRYDASKDYDVDASKDYEMAAAIPEVDFPMDEHLIADSMVEHTKIMNQHVSSSSTTQLLTFAMGLPVQMPTLETFLQRHCLKILFK
ncbi:hypothetical protein L2E82_25913 [Cichorium intybus]|uniref:Uncharacterized protein n=1 Tax=Cichorium intybus TaxID=13427 RepID=A0ACB9E4D3_CICIN|nr:hypothetical protein L2E82_25913 [Cichorium intybus]